MKNSKTANEILLEIRQERDPKETLDEGFREPDKVYPRGEPVNDPKLLGRVKKIVKGIKHVKIKKSKGFSVDVETGGGGEGVMRYVSVDAKGQLRVTAWNLGDYYEYYDNKPHTDAELRKAIKTNSDAHTNIQKEREIARKRAAPLLKKRREMQIAKGIIFDPATGLYAEVGPNAESNKRMNADPAEVARRKAVGAKYGW